MHVNDFKEAESPGVVLGFPLKGGLEVRGAVYSVHAVPFVW